MAEALIEIEGACHCGNLSYELDWPRGAERIAVRECGCTFCQMHGGTYTSHRDARLRATVADAALLTRYRFGTKTADFYVCSRCGVVPLVTSEIDGCLYAVVNVRTFRDVPADRIDLAVSDFDGEGTGDRLDRRRRTWIPSVTIESGAPGPG